MRYALLLAALVFPGFALPLPATPPEPTLTPRLRAVDLNVGESQEVALADGKKVVVKLLDLRETRDDLRHAVRRAEVRVAVDGREVALVSANYRLPVTVAGVRLDCPVTRGYHRDSANGVGSEDPWGLDKDARLRLWPAGEPLLEPGTFVYPVKQRWFASGTQMANEPVHVDGGESILVKKIYYHYGLDMGGAEGLVEVVAASDGLVVSSGKAVLPGYQDTPVQPRYDVIYVLDRQGWYERYSHLHTIGPDVKPGARITMGQRLGLLGKEGGSGGWSHLHFDIFARQPSGKWGVVEGYAFLWEAYLQEHQPKLLAVARPHHLAAVGEKVTLDGSRSWAAGKVASFDWAFGDGTTATGATAEHTYTKPGVYSEVLKVTDDAGHVDYDFAVVNVLDPAHPDQLPPSIHAAYFPTFGVKPGDPVTFLVRTFRTTDGKETWDFGDGTPPVEVHSDGNVVPLARDGYARTAHRYDKPGHYLVRVSRTDRHGFTAIAHLHVEVEQARTNVPPWDARGVGPLPWQGVACLDVNADGSLLAVGTIAPAGDPNVLVLDAAGKVVRRYAVGQRWISQVAFGPDGQEVFAVCTMPEGRAGDRPEVFRLAGDRVVAEKLPSEHGDMFHYGDHSNHATLLLARQPGVTAVLQGSQVLWPAAAPGQQGAARVPLGKDDLSVALAVDPLGAAVVGTTADGLAATTNLYVVEGGRKQPLWSRPVQADVDAAPPPEKGLYGTPTLPDGRREGLPQRDEKVWAPLAVAVHVAGAKTAAPQRRMAAADYQGWHRWVRSSATLQDADLGVRFMPSRPTVTVYDAEGKVLRRFAPESFARPFWCDLQFLPDGKRLLAWPHHWASRGLAGQPVLPADKPAATLYVLDVAGGKVVPLTFPDALCDVAVGDQGEVAASCWDGKVYLLLPEHLAGAALPPASDVDGPALVHVVPGGGDVVVAGTGGVVRRLDRTGKQLWRTDLAQSVPRVPKPWVANARATPIVPGVWQLPGGRVESDLGGQRLVEAPDGLILIEAHSGLSFEREWEAIKAVGLDPMRIKYVLATHEHGDHAPGAYLWRVATGARFVCSAEMAYTLQHHVPLNSGYGLHPPVPTDVRITEDTDLDLAGLKVRAVRIPGHTYGSMAWRFEKSGKTFVAFGDLIMPRGVLGYSGSVNFSARDVLASLQKLRDLKPDLVLPGHGAVEGPENYLAAGVDVGHAVGWGFIRPERPDPYFRIAQKNVVVAAWNLGAASAAFGDVDGDGRPDVVVVAPAGSGSVVKVFLNKGGKFADEPDHTILVPQVSQPHKVRLVPGKDGPRLFVAGKSAALLEPAGKVPGARIVHIDLGDGNLLRIVGQGGQEQTVLASRFGGCQILQAGKGAARLTRFQPEVTGPYVDLQALDLNGDGREDLVTSYGQVFLRGEDGTLPGKASLLLPVEKGEWTFLAVGDFNADGKPDVALLSYGMNGATIARVFYNQGSRDRPFRATPDAVIPLGETGGPGKGTRPPLLRDAPVVADWNGDGVADLVVGHGQSAEVLILFGGKDGLDTRRSEKIKLDYRTHYETGLYVGDFNGDGRPDLAVFGDTNTGVGAGGPPAAYIWLQPPRK